MIQMQIIGNLGADPERRMLDDGRTSARFSVAVSKKVKGRDAAEWVTVTTFDNLAENCLRYLKKGRKIYAQGEPRAYGYRNKLEEITARLEMNAYTVEFLSGREEVSQDAAPAAPEHRQPSFTQIDDEELPF